MKSNMREEPSQTGHEGRSQTAHMSQVRRFDIALDRKAQTNWNLYRSEEALEAHTISNWGTMS
jgi:hypothetical protein